MQQNSCMICGKISQIVEKLFYSHNTLLAIPKILVLFNLLLNHSQFVILNMEDKTESRPSAKDVNTESYTSATAYANAVNIWLSQYHSWCQMQAFNMNMSYYMMGYCSASHSHNNSSPTITASRPAATTNAQQRNNLSHRQAQRQQGMF